MSIEFNTWLLGLGGYAGLFGALAVVYLYPNVPRNYLPALFLVPVVSAAALYTFFQVLYTVLWFTVQVLEAMLNEHITIILLSTTFIGGQAILIGYVVYKNAFVNNILLNHAGYEQETDEDDEGSEGEEEEGGDEGDEGEELQPEEYTNADEADSGADADNEEGALNSAPTVTNDPPTMSTPVVPPQCVGCDADCIKCMPPLISLDKLTGMSGETLVGLICEDGVCRIDGCAADAIKNMLDELDETVKID